MKNFREGYWWIEWRVSVILSDLLREGGIWRGLLPALGAVSAGFGSD